jgi:hypothetical protein
MCALILLIARRARNKHRAHKMIVRGMCIAILRMLHQARHAPPQLWPAVIRDDILHRLTELQCPRLGRRLLREVVAVLQHGAPDIAVEVVYGAAGADEQVVLVAEGAQRRADFHVVVRVEAGVHGDECCWGTAVWEHPDQDEIGVVDPVEVGVGLGVKAFGFQHLDAAVCGRNVGVQLVVGVLGWVNICDGAFVGGGVGGDLDLVV